MNNITPYLEEYAHLAHVPPKERVSALMVDHEWTRDAALTIMALAVDYGEFILINALAVAVALDIEDGELGL